MGNFNVKRQKKDKKVIIWISCLHGIHEVGAFDPRMVLVAKRRQHMLFDTAYI